MPRDGIPQPAQTAAPSADRMTAAQKLYHLADFMETLDQGQLDLRTVHHACGTTHCAWGWGEIIGLFPLAREGAAGEDDAGWTREMLSAKQGCSEQLGLTDAQFRACFGMGYQFRSLERPYTPADVARNLRRTAAELETGQGG